MLASSYEACRRLQEHFAARRSECVLHDALRGERALLHEYFENLDTGRTSLADWYSFNACRPADTPENRAVAAAYRDQKLTMQQCATLFGVSRTTVMKFLAAEGVAPHRAGRDLDEPAVAAAYRNGLSLRECAARFGVSERRITTVLQRQGVPRRPVGRPPQRTLTPEGQPDSAAWCHGATWCCSVP